MASDEASMHKLTRPRAQTVRGRWALSDTRHLGWRQSAGTASTRQPLPRLMASTAPLEFVDDRGPGITRKKMRHGWAYYDPDGKRITDRDEIDRLNKIALPPAYTNAWYCPSGCGHILA